MLSYSMQCLKKQLTTSSEDIVVPWVEVRGQLHTSASATMSPQYTLNKGAVGPTAEPKNTVQKRNISCCCRFVLYFQMVAHAEICLQTRYPDRGVSSVSSAHRVLSRARPAWSSHRITTFSSSFLSSFVFRRLLLDCKSE